MWRQLPGLTGGEDLTENFMYYEGFCFCNFMSTQSGVSTSEDTQIARFVDRNGDEAAE